MDALSPHWVLAQTHINALVKQVFGLLRRLNFRLLRLRVELSIERVDLLGVKTEMEQQVLARILLKQNLHKVPYAAF
jgi:hypothetical protein